MSEKVTLNYLRSKKAESRKITMLTCYDFNMARHIDDAGIDISFVGDSMGNVILGYRSTVPVTVDDIVHHTAAVARGTVRAFLVGDMPFMSYNVSAEDAVRNAGRIIKEGSAEAVKLEGGCEVADTVRRIVKAGIPVMGHLGFTPQTAVMLGGSVVQGKSGAAAHKLIEDAKALEEAGAFSLVLECVPWQVAEMITAGTSMITIGIGAGPHCDGQVLVTHDLLGLTGGKPLKFVKRYADLGKELHETFTRYRQEVEAGAFPSLEHSFNISEEELEALKG